MIKPQPCADSDHRQDCKLKAACDPSLDLYLLLVILIKKKYLEPIEMFGMSYIQNWSVIVCSDGFACS